MKRFLLYLCSLLIISFDTKASPYSEAMILIDDVYDLLKSPMFWDQKDWILAGSVVGTTIFLFTQDEKIKRFTQQEREEEFDRFLSIGNTFGDGYFVIPFISLSLFSGYAFRSEKLIDFGWRSLRSFLITGSVVVVMKFVTNRERPNGSDRRAFPSGHSAVAFALATSISEEFGDNKAIPIFVYSMATLTALARVEYNVHWFSDVFLGAVLGIYISKFIHGRDRSRISMHLFMDGVAISWRF